MSIEHKQEIARLEDMTVEDLARMCTKLRAQNAQLKARAAGLETYTAKLNDERRPVALENTMLRRDLHDANVRIDYLKGQLAQLKVDREADRYTAQDREEGEGNGA